MNNDNPELNEEEAPKADQKKKGRPQSKKSVLSNSFQFVKEDIPIEPPPPPPPVISANKLNSLTLPKKPLSEAQKANFQKMLDANKKRREEKGLSTPTIPEEVPEGYKAVYVAPKGEKRNRVEKPKPPPQDLYEMMRQMNERMNSFTMPQPIPQPIVEKVKEKPKPPKATRKKRETTTEEENSESENYDTSDTEYITKYQKKAQKRMEAIQQIESRLKPAPPRNKYDHLSLF